MNYKTLAGHCKALIVVSSLSFSFFACKKETKEAKEVVTAVTTAEALKNAILGLGVADSSIVEQEDGFLVEGDIWFAKKDAEKYIKSPGLNNGRETQQRMTYLVDYYLRPVTTGSNDWVRRNVTIFVSNLNGTGKHNWTAAISEAVTEWNRILNAGIRLTLTSDEASADIVIRPDYDELASNFLALASYTTADGNPGSLIRINTDFDPQTSDFPAGNKKFVIIHEIGHCLGLFHTNSNDGTHIPGTPTSDGNSVMTGGNPYLFWGGFSSGDQLAARTLYPLPRKHAINEITGNLAIPDEGYMPVSWNSTMFSGSTVKIELYTIWRGGPFDQMFLRQTIALSAPNTGYLAQAINYAWPTTYDFSIVKITSNDDPAQVAFSNEFRLARD